MLENDTLRLLPPRLDLAPALCDYYRRNRTFLSPFDPVRPETFFTSEDQRAVLAEEIAAETERRGYRFYITLQADPTCIIGAIGLSNVVWGAFRSAFLGYKLDEQHVNAGVMTAAVALVTDYAFQTLGLHRIEANVMPRNKASLRVLEKNGYTAEGMSRQYLNINGVWEDHIHMVRLNSQERSNSMSILIQNGTLILPQGPTAADLRVNEGKISEIGANLPVGDSKTVDAGGKLVFPGFIDTHTHFEMNKGLPTESADNWAAASRSALAGGTTTVLDFSEPLRGASLQSGLDEWHSRADGVSSCNYSFHMTIKDWDSRIAAELPAMTAQGITSYKVYMAYVIRMTDVQIYEALQAIAKEGAVCGCHCENGPLADERIAQLLAAGRTGPDSHPVARPPEVEAEAVDRWLTIAELVGIPVNIVHLSTARSLEHVRAARARGQKVYVETCPQYLFLDESVYHLPGFESAKYIFAPPARPLGNQEALWKGIEDGAVDTIGTDHCSFDYAGAKQLGKDDFSKIPGGLPGTEDRPVLMYTAGVAGGRISANRMMELLSEQPARLFGMFPRKGTLAVGSDGDIVIFDPDKTGCIQNATRHNACDYDPYEGMATVGAVETVLLNGEVAVEGGEPVLEHKGQFVKRGPAQFWR